MSTKISLRETALTYEPRTTYNIAELNTVDLSLPMEARVFEKDGEERVYNVIVVEGEDYRVPNSVVSQVKTLLENKPEVTHVKVIRKGTGMNTRYTVLEA